MSIPVDPQRLAEALGDFDGGYLLSTSGDGRVKVVAVEPRVDPDSGARLLVDRPGKGSAANVAANRAVTLLFPPRAHHGYSLIADGSADGDADRMAVTVSGAVLHRPSSHADGPVPADGCGQDCQRLG
ncbi:pyridoxamine 5'-phosphate oxidase [Nocardioides terrisoli]|uniref:pyridoxamine 5'-phosphate oxidase n=1 Tax=Nocardioides terrisoli TaxID=3388267 RepID=UPI00287B7A9C|nr:pyridoxamine 5'-phosphate oxidase [Nocardioides marmorisolisilvae]